MPALAHRGPLDALRFDDRFVRAIPGDPEPRIYPRQVTGACYSRVAPTTVSAPTLVAFSDEVAAQIGLSAEAVRGPAFAQVFSGNRQLPGMAPYAARYGGHQFGSWAGQLGDGRAITLGEVLAPGGRLELQLKGAGQTPYSRGADGRAVMRSSVREFLCSEAMHHLGVPTTRALSLVATGDPVPRDMFYTGDVREEPGAIVCRVAPTFLRFGSFEILAARRETDLLRRLAEDTLATWFPHLGAPSPEVYAAWLAEVGERTAEMVTHWARVGFVHGVMNTDNMSILGLTIDYGPYGWLEPFDPDWTPNTTDAHRRRYRFGNQPAVGGWNLARLAEAIYPLVGSAEPLQEALSHYSQTLAIQRRAMMAAKLGLQTWRAEDDALVDDLWSALPTVEVDVTIFFRRLADVPAALEGDDRALTATIADALYAPDDLPDAAAAALGGWLRRYLARARDEGLPDDRRRAAMNAVNPKYVLRNYLAQLAIDKAEVGDPSLVSELLDVLRRPYDEQPEEAHYAAKRPEWARNRPGCSTLSCSS